MLCKMSKEVGVNARKRLLHAVARCWRVDQEKAVMPLSGVRVFCTLNLARERDTFGPRLIRKFLFTGK